MNCSFSYESIVHAHISQKKYIFRVYTVFCEIPKGKSKEIFYFDLCN